MVAPVFFSLLVGFALGIILLPGRAVAPDFQIEIFAQRVDARHADAVQSAGNFVSRRIKFSAGMQRGHDDLRRGNFLAIDHHVVDRNAAPVVDDRDGVVEVNRDFNLGGESGERFVDGIVDDFVHEVMQAEFARRSDVHGGTFAHGLHAAQHFDRVGVVAAVAVAARGRDVRCVDRSHFSVFCFGVCDGSIESLWWPFRSAKMSRFFV